MQTKLTRIPNIIVLLLTSVLWPSLVAADDLDIIEEVNTPQMEHISQQKLNELVGSDPQHAYEEAFEVGDEIFEIQGNALDGIGANVGNGQKFAKFPRMDLDGPEEWANHTPARVTGPNGVGCDTCHNQPVSDGAGSINSNNVRDPSRSGDISLFITRQPPHIFGIGAKQLLAEEMTADLHTIRDKAIAKAVNKGKKETKKLKSKGVNFGKITANPDGSVDYSEVKGVDIDLVIKPLEWKGVSSSIRSFVRGAANNELGLQATEIVGHDKDGDFDGIVNELGVGDITALAIYQAGQARPVTKLELADLGLITLTKQEIKSIKKGKKLFAKVKCATCHKPRLQLLNPVFSEPSQSAAYQDEIFPSGGDPLEEGLNPATAVTFDLTTDMLDNILLINGKEVHLGNFKKDKKGRTNVDIFSDLKRHYMGEGLRESVDETGHGAAVFITQPLWGAGSTPPYMHDGRASTITAAILTHGGEAKKSRNLFKKLSPRQKADVSAYVENNVIFKDE